MYPLLSTLRARLLIGSAIPLVLFLAVALIGWVVIQGLLAALAEEKRSNDVAVLALQQRQKLETRRDAVSRAASEFQGALPRDYHTRREEFYQIHRRLLARSTGQADQEQRLHSIRAIEEDWHRLVVAHFEKQTDRPAAGPRFRQESQRFDRRSEELLKRLDTALNDFTSEAEGLLEARRAETARQARQSVTVIAAASTLALVLTVVVALQSARTISRPLERLRNAAAQLPSGEVSLVAPDGPAEIAELIVHFNHMAMSLAQRVSILQAREERYRTYLGAVAPILWTANGRGEVAGDLPGWRAYTGQGDLEIQGSGWLAAVHPEDLDAFSRTWRAAVAGRSLFEAEGRLRGRDGQYRPFACRAVPLLTPTGEVREWIGTCTDVSDQKQQAELRQAKEAAEARSRAKSKFLARMSHELRTPLNAVIGMSRMLATQRFGPLNAKQLDYVNDVTQAGEHLLALINDVLDLTKVEAGRMEVRADSFALGSAVAALVSTLRPLADVRGVTLSIDAPAEDGLLHTDTARFRQVLYNLLSNAIKFTPPGGKVTLRCRWLAEPRSDSPEECQSKARAVQVAIQDTGIGIPSDDQAAVWEEFRQLRAPVGEEVKGTGLGLSLTRRLVGLLGGEIDLTSEPGQGSTFTFVLPRQVPPTENEDARAADSAGRPRALVVEDHAPTNRLLCDWLRGAGLDPVPALDGEDALARVRHLRPSLIVLDLHLPRLDGWHLLTELKSDPQLASIPVVVVTAAEDATRVGDLGVVDFFVKPVDREALLQRLRLRLPHLLEGETRGRVLVVDDDRASLTLLGDLLRGEGFEVEAAESGPEALRKLGPNPPALVVLDLMLPGQDGFSVVEQMHAQPGMEEVPVLVVTARHLTAQDRQRLSGHIKALIPKGRLNPQTLHQQLERMGVVAEREST